MPPMFERIGMHDLVDRFLRHARQARIADDGVDVFQSFKRFLHCRERKIRAPENLAAVGDGVFLGANQDIPKLPGPVIQRRDLAINIRVLARRKETCPCADSAGRDNGLSPSH